MRKTRRTHLVNAGTMPASIPKKREPMLSTPTRHVAPNNRGSVRSNMGRMCDNFALFGVNANPFRSGTTSGEGVIISRRYKLA